MGRLQDIDQDVVPANILAPVELPEEILLKDVVLCLQGIQQQWQRELEAVPDGAWHEKSAYTWAGACIQGDLRRLELLQKTGKRTGESAAKSTVDRLILTTKERIASIPGNSRNDLECQQIQAGLMARVLHTLEGMG